MDKIKLVIWDLDETFWRGTLSEEGITPINYNIKLVETLSKRGIVNSIVSKNNFEEAKKTLEGLGVWEYFVFPKIDWLPKGELVRDIISQAHLRSENILFLDDNHLNLEEVLFYNSGIHVRLPDFISKIEHHKAFKGKNDPDLSRLDQYKVLEKKLVKSKSFSNNLEFLKFSEIKVRYSEITDSDLARISELVERTNQLNFTKRRDSFSQIEELLRAENIKSEKIEVWDKFGDYGVVGFYALDMSINKLIHFVFSCRTINIGIEQHIYSKLNFPKIDIIGDVSGNLSSSSDSSWIEEVTVKKTLKDIEKKDQISILIKGGCDLEQMTHYLTYKNIDVNTEFNTVSLDNIPLHKEHSIFLLSSKEDNFWQNNYKALEFIPFIDEYFYKSDFFSQNNDILVYSLLMDYTQVVYQHKINKVRIAYGGYSRDLVNNNLERFNDLEYIDNEFIRRFKKEFVSLGQISIADFRNNITKIINSINVPIIFINGCEISPLFNNEDGCVQRHIRMNQELDHIIKENDNCFLLDMRKIIQSQNDIDDNIRHYKRNIYEKMGNELVSLVQEIKDVNFKKNRIAFLIGTITHYLKTLKRYLLKG